MQYSMQAHTQTQESPPEKTNGRHGQKPKTETRDIRIRTLLKHNPFGEKEDQEEELPPEQNIETLAIQIQQQTQQGKTKNEENTNKEENTPCETLGYMKRKYENIGQTYTKWHCDVANCNRASNNPDNLAKHIAKTHKEHSIRISRQKANFPLCNKEYSNLIALLTHLEMRTTKMTWQPKICKIIQQKIIPPDSNTTSVKWKMIQEHNEPKITPEQQHRNIQKYTEAQKKEQTKKTNSNKL